MKTNRRDFIKTATLAGTGIITGTTTSCVGEKTNKPQLKIPHEISAKKHKQSFNMSGYAAPKLDVVRIGYIGIGGRGLGSVKRMRLIDGVEIRALCDILEDRVQLGQNALIEMGMPAAKTYSGSEEIWKEMCQDPELDLIYIATPRHYHPEMCVFSMENDKHAVTEIPAILNIEDAWRLVETSEKTKKHCSMLENCTYDFWELMALNMSRQGFFGEVIHVDAGYIHDQRELNVNKAKGWRIEEFINRNGNVYPTHGLGPACQLLNINRGDRLDYLVSTSSNDFTMGPKIAELAKNDDYYKKYVDKWHLGNMNTSTIRTKKGKTIMLQYNVSNPRPYDRIQQVVGTNAISKKYPFPSRIALGDEWLNEEETAAIVERYTPKLITLVGEMAKKVGGHGGMDFLMEWRLIDCLRNGLPLDMDVYDAAAWSAVVPLSEWSVANFSSPVSFPDFTSGSYKTNAPVDIEMLNGGGNTKIKNIR
ncbi:MAG: Gfo/Idh/MocA family oxidoreductase [Dysgonamonadaceae bacterium]|nr:Gfo/Idh/MocA family oxidoreductase [Dysgonamonadaceae bacterium]MDD4727837.1 Gfo/Idh/MocA family oxidoreductase [Dysgonamonadaceae bacterium]